MATYYVGIGGNDGNSGLTWALRKLTLNGAEDVPVIANDTVYVGPGTYRELLTVDVSGGAGTEIVYIGDVSGEHTDGIGGTVRITGSDDDQTATRLYCIQDAGGFDYRTFRGLSFDTVTTYCIVVTGASTNWTFEDCSFSGAQRGISVSNDNQADWTIRRCTFSVLTAYGVYMVSAAGILNAGHVLENLVISSRSQCIRSDEVGGITIQNCTLLSTSAYAIQINVALPGGYTAVTVGQCLFSACIGGVRAVNLGELVEDYNLFYNNSVDRNTVNVGGNSVTYPPLFEMPLLHAGASQVSGYRYPWWSGALSEWSQVGALAGASERTVDLLGIARPATAAKNSWGALQYQGQERDTGTTYDGSTASLSLPDAGRVQFKIPTADATEITISVRAYREANYAGTNPRLIVKQPGQSDDTTTDAAAASQWNELTTTLTPADEPDYVIVELASLNTAAAGNYAAFFDALTVDSSPSVGDLDNWVVDRIPFSDVQAAGGGGAVAAPILGPSAIAR